jgi:molybdopterin-guanine dinucleotide biosynthesis protein A
MSLAGLLPIGAYILAGGRSTRMGHDKALLELAGKPLVQHAATKLARLTNDVNILGSSPELARFAPVVPDLHENCGPIGGLEAALEHSPRDWTLVLPVDMPFLPTFFLECWVREVIDRPAARVALFTVDGRPFPTLCLMHRDVRPFVQKAVSRDQFKLYPVLENAAQELSESQNQPMDDVFLNRMWDDTEATTSSVMPGEGSWKALTKAQLDARRLWFANLNTPEEFLEAKQRVDALDT